MVMVRVSIRASWVVNFALFRCYRPVIYTRPNTFIAVTMPPNFGGGFFGKRLCPRTNL